MELVYSPSSITMLRFVGTVLSTSKALEREFKGLDSLSAVSLTITSSLSEVQVKVPTLKEPEISPVVSSKVTALRSMPKISLFV